MATGTLEKCALHGLMPVSTLTVRWRCVGEWFADVNVVNRVSRGEVMVWADISYEQTQLHFIDGKFECTDIP